MKKECRPKHAATVSTSTHATQADLRDGRQTALDKGFVFGAGGESSGGAGCANCSSEHVGGTATQQTAGCPQGCGRGLASKSVHPSRLC